MSCSSRRTRGCRRPSRGLNAPPASPKLPHANALLSGFPATPPRLAPSCLVLHALRAATTARPYDCWPTSLSLSAPGWWERRRQAPSRARSAPSAAAVRRRPQPAARPAATRSCEGSRRGEIGWPQRAPQDSIPPGP
ncbi:hypothetical protein ABW17_22150 [Mycobacterium nebraskense]|nr:hypothetical protein ABW17_22150 [Mycobacterium nebraskense]